MTRVEDERTKAARKQRKRQQAKLDRKRTKIEGQLTTATADLKAKERECDDLVALQKQNVKTAQAELDAAQEKLNKEVRELRDWRAYKKKELQPYKTKIEQLQSSLRELGSQSSELAARPLPMKQVITVHPIVRSKKERRISSPPPPIFVQGGYADGRGGRRKPMRINVKRKRVG